MTDYTVEHVQAYRMQCEANWDAPEGCSGTGPRAFSYREARELAQERGWESRRNRFCCPAHIKALEA